MTIHDTFIGKIYDRSSSDGQYGAYWTVLPAGSTMADAVRTWHAHGLDTERTWCQHEYDCCGRTYHSALRIARSTGTRVLAVQSWSVNI